MVKVYQENLKYILELVLFLKWLYRHEVLFLFVFD